MCRSGRLEADLLADRLGQRPQNLSVLGQDAAVFEKYGLDPGEALWERRVKETHAAAEILGVQRVEFLGYCDSGMIGTPENDLPGSFWTADVEEAASRLGLTPKARFHTFALAGVDPVFMLTGPIPATTKVLERAKMTLDQMDLVEINEAFAPVVLAWEKEHHPDMAKVNVNGGAIALGHPLGCSGARLAATLLHELERTDGRWGLQVMCEGGGMANAMIVERLG